MFGLSIAVAAPFLEKLKFVKSYIFSIQYPGIKCALCFAFGWNWVALCRVFYRCASATLLLEVVDFRLSWDHWRYFKLFLQFLVFKQMFNHDIPFVAIDWSARNCKFFQQAALDECIQIKIFMPFLVFLQLKKLWKSVVPWVSDKTEAVILAE